MFFSSVILKISNTSEGVLCKNRTAMSYSAVKIPSHPMCSVEKCNSNTSIKSPGYYFQCVR